MIVFENRFTLFWIMREQAFNRFRPISAAGVRVICSTPTTSTICDMRAVIAFNP